MIGLLFTAGVCQTKDNLNNRLVGEWYSVGEDEDAMIFKSNGKVLYRLSKYNEDKDDFDYDTLSGTWSTIENEIFLKYGKNKTEEKIYYFKKFGDYLHLTIGAYVGGEWTDKSFFKP
jgi:hypothetical protein